MNTDTHDVDPLQGLLGGVSPSAETIGFCEARGAVLGRLFGEPVAPTRVDRYEIGEHLGGGGQGDVYRAFDPKLGRSIALKLPHRDGVSPAEFALSEARAMAAVSHRNVVSVYDVGHDGSRLYLAMELLEGQSLWKWQVEPRSASDVLDAYREAGRGLAAAHEAGVVHGDFKASNVLVAGSRVAVTDFGLAKMPSMTESLEDGTDVTSVRGTLRYMAPEVQQGERATALSDQYSFCVSLREALGEHLDSLVNVRVALDRGEDVDPTRRFEDMTGLVAALGRPEWLRRTRRALSVAATTAVVIGAAAWLWPTRPLPRPIYYEGFSSVCSEPQCPEPVQGVRGQAARFGGSHALDVRELSSLRLDSLTVAAWIKPSTLEIDHQSIFAKPLGDSGEDSWELMLYDEDGDGEAQLSFGISDGAHGRMASAPDGALEPDQWVFVSGTWDGSEVTVWIDGSAVASAPAQNIAVDGGDALVGGDRDGVGGIDDFFYGDVDELSVYERALDEAQLTELLRADLP